MSKPKYFLGIKIAHQKHSVLLSQQEYAQDHLEETRLLKCRPMSTPIEADVGQSHS